MFSSRAGDREFTRAIRFFLVFVLTSAFGNPRSMAQQQATESPVPSIAILVTDFELFSVVPRATPSTAPVATPPTTPIATPSAAPIATTPAAPIAIPSATPITTAPNTPIATPPAIPITTASPLPIATASATPTDTPPAAQAAAPTRQKPPLPLDNGDTDLPSVQARRLMDLFSETLLQILQKKGYNAARASEQIPARGAIIRGVFAETDAKNRIRRSLWGGTSGNTRFFLYAGIFNLGRPDQPLYQLAAEQPGGGQFGPVITLNNYVPLAKYELDKNPTEEDVRKICAQIAASLTALLAANPNAFAQ
jgi:hypothetical protein